MEKPELMGDQDEDNWDIPDYLLRTETQEFTERAVDLLSSEEEDISVNVSGVFMSPSQYLREGLMSSSEDEDLGTIVSPNAVIKQERSESAPPAEPSHARKQIFKKKEEMPDNPKPVRHQRTKNIKKAVVKDPPLHTRDPASIEDEETKRRSIKAKKAYAYRKGKQHQIEDLTRRNALLEVEKALAEEKQSIAEAKQAVTEEENVQLKKLVLELKAQLRLQDDVGAVPVVKKRKR